MIPLLNDERWIDIEYYENEYSVSNFGRVYSHKGKGKILKPCPIKTGYFMVGLCKDGKSKSFYLHALVGNAFVGKREGEMSFDHIDRNNQNNRAANIRLATKTLQSINQKIHCNNKTGEKNISIRGNSFMIQIKRNNKCIISKSYKMKDYSLDDVIKERNEFLETYNKFTLSTIV